MKANEIPKGSRLYFNTSAKLKRKIENSASEILLDENFDEIVTPYFFKSKDLSNKQDTINIHMQDNSSLSLRPDSTIEVLRLVKNRINNNQKKWFYIQPIFLYPSYEYYQIGVEYIDFHDLAYIMKILTNILKTCDISYTFQISNINIVKLLIEKYNVPKEIISPLNLEELLKINNPWISSLVHIHSLDDLKDLSIYPDDIKQELIILKENIQDIYNNNDINTNIVIEPLYYDDMQYYESLYFRVFSGNSLLSKGGIYKDRGTVSSGFCIYTDQLIEQIAHQG